MKTGDGVFSAPSLPSVSTLTITGGTLQSTASYAFNGAGEYVTFVSGGGDHGRLATSATALLGGAITVQDGGGLYADGQSFNVVTGSSVTGSFASETLPEATALLSFDMVHTSNAVQVVANAASFTTVASTEQSDQIFASQLDKAALVAGGALASHLAKIQRLPDGADIEAEIAQLNPARFSNFARDTAATVDRFESGARQRLAELRQIGVADERPSGFVRGVKPLRFAQSSQIHVGDGVTYGAWKAEFGAADNALGKSQGSVSGFDYLTPAGAVIGASFGSTKSYSLLAPFTGEDGSVDAFMLSVYGSYRISDNQYLDAVVSYGAQDYDTSVPVLDGAAFSSVQSEHAGKSVSASIETGRSFSLAGGRSEVFGGARYESIGEDRFNAASLGDVAFDVSRRDLHSLEGEVGVRFGWSAETPAGALAPRISMSWSRLLSLAGDRLFASFADAPGYTFDLPGDVRNDNKIRIAAGFDLLTAHNVSVASRFEIDALSPEEEARGLMELKYRW